MTTAAGRGGMMPWLFVVLVGGASLTVALVVLALLDVAPALPLAVFALGIVSTLLTGLAICLLLLLRLLHLRHRPVSARPLVPPALAVGAGTLGLLVGYLAGPAPVPAESTSPGDQLAYMCKTDQRDRFTLRWLNTSRDEMRSARVLQLNREGLILAPEAMLDAAIVLQHGNDSSDYRVAHELAKAACEKGVNSTRWDRGSAEWLAKATYDRWMLSIGKPQVYGTQKEFTLGGAK